MTYKINSSKINKIKNVLTDNGTYKTFYAGETLPIGYVPPQDYIDNNIVEQVKKKPDKPEKKEEKIKEDKQEVKPCPQE